ncbi:MAG: Maf family nucleotide pyrophosphatase [Pseudomonadota bacterium]|nr:Maf family nucleotide pyrophosphatase [Pseudomonadota bacterium]
MSTPILLPERPSIYLASKSARRQELLRQLGVDFTQLLTREAVGRHRDVVEIPRKDEAPLEYIKRIARTKVSVGWHQMGRRGLQPKPVLAADTDVVLDGAVFGKPKDAPAAVHMLQRLSGRTHEVSTAVAVRWNTQVLIAVSSSQVTLRVLADDEIGRYVATSEPFDKAGAYAIQGRGATFVSRLDGSYSGVMGLPLFETADILIKLGFSVL